MQEASLVRASVLAPLLDALSGAPVRAEALLRRHGLTLRQLRDPYELIPLARYVGLFEDAAALLNDDCLGLRLGRSIRPADLGPVGILFVAQPTLRAALAWLMRALPILQGATRLELIEHGDLAIVSYRIEAPEVVARRQDAEFSLAVTCALTRSLLGNAWQPVEVQFEHAAPADEAPLSRFFGNALRFRQSANRIVIDRGDLDRATTRRETEATPFLERHVLDLLGKTAAPGTVRERVLQVIRRQLGQGEVSILTVAAALGTSPRSLQRSLGAEGTSWRSVLRDYRRESAEALIKAGDLSIGRIAEDLGYADPTVFWRAFRRWNGNAPRAYRLAERRAKSRAD